MQIFLNGKPLTVDDNISIDQLLERLSLKGRLAIEINQNILPRSKYHNYLIQANDTIEIIHAVGGG